MEKTPTPIKRSRAYREILRLCYPLVSRHGKRKLFSTCRYIWALSTAEKVHQRIIKHMLHVGNVSSRFWPTQYFVLAHLFVGDFRGSLGGEGHGHAFGRPGLRRQFHQVGGDRCCRWARWTGGGRAGASHQLQHVFGGLLDDVVDAFIVDHFGLFQKSLPSRSFACQHEDLKQPQTISERL